MKKLAAPVKASYHSCHHMYKSFSLLWCVCENISLSQRSTIEIYYRTSTLQREIINIFFLKGSRGQDIPTFSPSLYGSHVHKTPHPQLFSSLFVKILNATPHELISIEKAMLAHWWLHHTYRNIWPLYTDNQKIEIKTVKVDCCFNS